MVDVTSRKKCNYCRFRQIERVSWLCSFFFYRFEKCKIKGMDPDLKENQHQHIKVKNPETKEVCDELKHNQKEQKHLEFDKNVPESKENKHIKVKYDELEPIPNELEVKQIEENLSVTEEVNKEEFGDEHEQNQNSEMDCVAEKIHIVSVQDIPQSLSFHFGAAEFKRLHFFVDLWHMQKVVQPLGLPNIIPILESLKNKKQIPSEVVKNNFMVSSEFFIVTAAQ